MADSDAALEKELLRLISPWQTTAEMRVRGGYRDNVLLSSVSPEGSAFISALGEGGVTRRLGDAGALEGFGMLDYRHYFGSTNVSDELSAFAMVNWRTDLGSDWQAGLAGEYLFQDQVIDVSANEVDLSIVEVQGHGVGLRPSVRRDLGSKFWLELEGRGQRSLYAEPLDDTWEGGAALSGGWKPRQATELTLGYSYANAWYDTETERDADGSAIAGTHRETARHELRTTWREYWDPARRFQSTVRVAGRLNRDGGAGYYDYDRLGIEARLRYERGPWRCEASTRAAWYEYLLQQAWEPDGPFRRRTELGAEFALSYRFLGHWAATADYNWEQTTSNRGGEDYTVNTVSAGIAFEF